MSVGDDALRTHDRGVLALAPPRPCGAPGLDGRCARLSMPAVTPPTDGAPAPFCDADVLENALQSAERARDYAQSIVETVPLSLLVLDAELQVVSANPTFHRTFGTTAEDTLRAPLFALAGGAWDVACLHHAIDESLVHHAPFRDLDVQCTFPGHGAQDLLITGTPLGGPHGELMVLLAFDDVTARRRLEVSEKAARVESERANSAKDQFLATVSHELRTPLSTISMSAQSLLWSDTEDLVIQRASAMIQRAVAQQKRLIDDLLDISRIVSGKLMMEVETLALGTVVQAAVDAVRGAAEAKGLQLELYRDGFQRSLRGDPVRLHQVVSNLLHNAIKFTPRGGQITVRLEAESDRARLSVSDTGTGIAPDVLPRLFERFVQAPSAMTRDHGGMGLGLAIVRHLVEEHGGEVRAASLGERRGATFTVTLPLIAEPAGARA